jgi:hypothetical protein
MEYEIMKIIPIAKATAQSVCGTLTQTSKMPCKSISLPTESCITGFKMAQIEGSICSKCYADKGFYSMYQNTIKPAQFARLDAVWQAMDNTDSAELWVSGIVSLIGNDAYFRWHDAGDLQGLEHLELIVAVCNATPHCQHWLPTREYGIVKQYIAKHGALPANLTIRLSAMYPDQPVKVPASLQGVKGVAISNVHTAKPIGEPCKAPEQGGACLDCRACWTDATVSYALH